MKANVQPEPGARDPPWYRFEDVAIDTHARLVLRDGEPVPLEPKSYAVLLALVRRPGELLTREELLDEVWGHRHVTPGVLTRAVAQLRHALGDDPHAPRFIRTRHALGYCFIGRLEQGSVADDWPDLPELLGAEGGAPRPVVRVERRTPPAMPVLPTVEDRPVLPPARHASGAASRWWMPVALAAVVGVLVWLAWALWTMAG